MKKEILVKGFVCLVMAAFVVGCSVTPKPAPGWPTGKERPINNPSKTMGNEANNVK